MKTLVNTPNVDNQQQVCVVMQVLMAIVARCCLHTMYEFTAFMNMWAVESLGVSGGVAAQVSFLTHSPLLS